jgi:hypothetical protein
VRAGKNLSNAPRRQPIKSSSVSRQQHSLPALRLSLLVNCAMCPLWVMVHATYGTGQPRADILPHQLKRFR